MLIVMCVVSINTICRYKEINVRLKRLLGEERKSLQQLRQTYAAELKSRSELELLLRQCVDDVRKEIGRRYVSLSLCVIPY